MQVQTYICTSTQYGVFCQAVPTHAQAVKPESFARQMARAGDPGESHDAVGAKRGKCCSRALGGNEISGGKSLGCGCQNRFGIPFWLVAAPPI